MKYIIHRGITSNTTKENTYQSIKKAIKDKNSCGVEFDIRLTKDNKIVLSHNSIIKYNKIENMTYSDIIKEKYLITLDKILSIKTEKILLIDIKVNKNCKRFANTLLKYIKDSNKNIYLCSFNKKIINYLKNKTNYKLAYILFNYKKTNNDFIMINKNNISNKKLLRTKDKEIFLWTFNNIKELTKIKNKYSNINKYYPIIDKEE